jgi:hypothetical protein
MAPYHSAPGKTMEQADMGEGPDAPHPVAKAEFE